MLGTVRGGGAECGLIKDMRYMPDDGHLVAHKFLCTDRCLSSSMYLMSLINPHYTPPTPTVPSMPTLQACSTRFNKGTNYVVNNAFAMATKPDLAMDYHRAAFSPVPTTFISAINKGNLSTWPVLTTELISKHLTKSLATAKCHNKLARQNVRSTRPQEPPVARTKTVQITVVEPSDLLAFQQSTKEISLHGRSLLQS